MLEDQGRDDWIQEDINGNGTDHDLIVMMTHGVLFR
jgi:hypothetical protein